MRRHSVFTGNGRVENLVEQLLQLNMQAKKEKAFKIFMEKMSVAEKSVRDEGYYSEEEVGEQLAEI